MKAFLLSFVYQHPEVEDQNAQSIALVYADSYDEACERINSIRAKNNLPPCLQFMNATIEAEPLEAVSEEPQTENPNSEIE